MATILIISFVLGYVGQQTALLTVANACIDAKSFQQFVSSIESKVYALITVSIALWFFMDVRLLMAYGIAYMITLCLIDYENTYDRFLNDDM